MYEKLSQCPLCQSSQFSNYLVVKDHVVSQESFSICKCQNCGLLFTNPRPNQESISQYYNSENYISHVDKSSNITNFIYKIVRKITLKQKLRWLNEQSRSIGRLLDFGCGTGYFLRTAKTDGWQVLGFEPNNKAARIALEKHQLHVSDNLSELEKEKKFDAITLFHVLEHVHDLQLTLELLISKLKKRGVIFIAVPNYNSYDSRFYKENWASLDVPRHLYHFTPKTMEILAKKYNLKIKSTIPQVFDSYYVSLLSEGFLNRGKKLINALNTGYKSNQLGKKETSNYSSLLFVLSKS